ncbi:MAG: hypothetical protein JJE04_14035 [Acidobacteriia bacterium]|nr:hypothetical protein [Terriglobia bacterium]
MKALVPVLPWSSLVWAQTPSRTANIISEGTRMPAEIYLPAGMLGKDTPLEFESTRRRVATHADTSRTGSPLAAKIPA